MPETPVDQSVYNKIEGASLLLPLLRNKVMLAGEGRMGKTTTRRALVGEKFNSTEPSTCGMESNDLVLDRSDVRPSCGNWVIVVDKTQEQKRQFARAVLGVLRGNMSIDQLSEEGGRTSLLRDVVKSEPEVAFDGDIQENQPPPATSTGPLPSQPTKDANVPSLDEKLTPDEPIAVNVGVPPRQSASTLTEAAIMALVGDYMAEKEVSPGFSLSLWDLAGQEVFMELHNLFLTPHGVSVVVFNLQELLLKPGQWLVGRPKKQVDSTTRNVCLRHLRLWLSSIYSFAPSTDGSKNIFIVGTCLDLLSCDDERRAEELDRVCEIIEDEVLIHHPALDQVQFAPDNRCAFFVNNAYRDHDGGADISVGVLRMAIEEAVVNQPHVHETAPMSWIRVLEAIGADEAQSTRGYDDFVALAKDCGLGRIPGVSLTDEVDILLNRFHGLGLLVWHSTRPELVVLDPLWLTTAASSIICDPSLHMQSVRREVVVKFKRQIDELYSRAILSALLLPVLLSQYTEPERAHVMALMEHYGLAVPLKGDDAVNQLWLIPSLLVGQTTPLERLAVGSADDIATCYFHFTTSEANSDAILLDEDWNLRAGFLPRSLFHRILGGVVRMQRGQQSPEVSQKQARFSITPKQFPNHISTPARYTLELLDDINCIELRVLSGIPCQVLSHLEEVVETVCQHHGSGTSRHRHRVVVRPARLGYIDVAALAAFDDLDAVVRFTTTTTGSTELSIADIRAHQHVAPWIDNESTSLASSPIPPPNPDVDGSSQAEVLISYATDMAKEGDGLGLALLKRIEPKLVGAGIAFYHGLKCPVGRDWHFEWFKRVPTTRMAVVMLSPMYFKSENCREELIRLIKRFRKDSGKIIPVIVGPTVESVRQSLSVDTEFTHYIKSTFEVNWLPAPHEMKGVFDANFEENCTRLTELLTHPERPG